MTARKTKARHFAFKFLYQFFYRSFDFTSNSPAAEFFAPKDLEMALKEFNESYSEPDEEHPQNLLLAPDQLEFAKKLLLFTINEKSELLTKIDLLTDRKKMKEPTLVMVILLLGASELANFPDTPKAVVLNEMIDLAKTYGSEDLAKLVNGVLDKLN